MTRRWLQWGRLYVWRSHYRCRCGWVIARWQRQDHEEFHAAMRRVLTEPPWWPRRTDIQ